MRIVIVDTTLQGPLIGGAQTFLPLLMKGLNEAGHEVHVITKGTPDKRIEKGITESGATIHPNLWKKNALVEDVASKFATWVNELNPDIYVISVSPDIGWLALPYLNPSIATFTVGHTDAETFYAPARHYHSFLTKAIAVSDQITKEYIASCHLSPQHVNWIPYGVIANTVAPLPHGDDVLKIIYVGRLDETQKRVSDLAEISKKLSAENISFNLKVVGDGPEMETFRNKLSAEIIAKKVELTGWLTSEEVAYALQSSDVFILTSAFEGFCIALVEAMANGCCPVVTNIKSGNSQLIRDPVNGFINEIGDVDAFVDKLTYLNNNRLELDNMRNKAWETGKQYSIDQMVLKYEQCFEEAARIAKTSVRKIDPGFPVMESCRSPYPLWLRRIKSRLFGLVSLSLAQ